MLLGLKAVVRDTKLSPLPTNKCLKKERLLFTIIEIKLQPKLKFVKSQWRDLGGDKEVPNGLLFHKKPLNMDPSFYKKYP